MRGRPKTYFELSSGSDNHYYAVIYLPSGHDYYAGPFKTRSIAYKYAVKEQAKHDRATQNHMIYNVRIGV